MSAAAQPYIEFDAETHSYYVDGEHVLSVTQILEMNGLIDPEWFTEEQGLRGTIVHDLILMTNTGKAPRVGPEVSMLSPGFMDECLLYHAQYKKFRADYKRALKISAAEEKVFDALHRFAGRLDFRGLLYRSDADEGEEAIFDVKTNRTGYVPEWAKWQLAAYAHALNPTAMMRRFALILTPTDYKLEEFPRDNYISDRDDFLAMVRVARCKQIHQGGNNERNGNSYSNH